ncbi:hypothetical protein GW931_02810 [archaeon]|nr:hypothetical protein [archaeon]
MDQQKKEELNKYLIKGIWNTILYIQREIPEGFNRLEEYLLSMADLVEFFNKATGNCV